MTEFVEDDSYPPLPDWVKPGATYRYDFGDPNNFNHGRVFHVRAVIDNRAVVREWLNEKQCWYYSVECFGLFKASGSAIVPDPPSPIRQETE